MMMVCSGPPPPPLHESLAVSSSRKARQQVRDGTHGASSAVEIDCNELVGGLSVDVDQVPSELQAGMSLTAIRQQWQGGDDSTISSSVGGEAPGGKTQLGGRRGGASLLGGNSSSREGGTIPAAVWEAMHAPVRTTDTVENLGKGIAIHCVCY